MDVKYAKPRQAVLRYGPVAYEVLHPGTFVTCAVTGQPIKLEDLHYWSITRQQPYSSAHISYCQYLDEMTATKAQ